MVSFILTFSAILTMEGNPALQIMRAKEIWTPQLKVGQKFEFHRDKRYSRYSSGVRFGYPDTATYIAASSGWLEPRIGAGGFLLCWVEAKIPGGEVDTTYQDTVDLKISEGIPNNSAQFYRGSPPRIPVTKVKLNNGRAMLWIKSSEPENLIIWAVPRDELKPSHPIPYTFEVRGGSATRIQIEGPKRINQGTEIGGRYLVRAVDNLGNQVPGYGFFVDTFRISIKVKEEIPDGSAKLFDIMTGEGDSLGVTLIYGQANIFLVDLSPERLTLIATSKLGDLAPDTFEVDVVPPDQSTIILPFSFSGTYGTKGVDKSIIAMAFAPGIEGPDPNNNSSQVELVVYDIIGTQSATISPTGPQTLTAGLAGFKLSDTEADLGVIVRTVPSGSPELSAWWMERVGFGFKNPGEATMIHPAGPTTAIVGDTITLYVYAVDGNDSLDLTYDGWVWIWIHGDDNGSCQVLEYGTGIWQNIIHIKNGIGRVWVTNSEPEEVFADFEDAEGEGFMGRYLGGLGPEVGIDISFELPGNTATKWVLELPSHQFSTGYLVTGTVKAVDNLGLVDTTFNDSAKITISGFASPSDTIVLTTKGIAMIKFSNDSVEKVTISVSGAGLIPYVDSVDFVSPGTPVWLVVPPLPDVLVKDSLPISIFAVTADFGFATTWNGVAKISYSDPGAPSLSWTANPDSIPITNGKGSIKMTNFEVESVRIELQYVSGNPPLTPMPDPTTIEFEAKLWAHIPDTALVGGSIDTMVFKTLDLLDSVINFTTWCRIWCREQIPNGSVVIVPSDSFQIINGIGRVQIENTEPESVWIYYFCQDNLVRPNKVVVERIVFTQIGVEEVSTHFSFSICPPNPSRSGTTVLRYSCPHLSDVSLKIYDLTGRLVRVLVDRKEKPGNYTVRWDGMTDYHKNVTQGIYFCKFKAGNFTSTQKIILLPPIK